MLNAEWCAQTSLRKKIAWHSQGALKVMHFMFLSWNGFVIDYPVPIGTTVKGLYCCPLLQDMVRLAVCCRQSELLEHFVILLQDNATPRCHCDVQNLLQRVGAGRYCHILLPLQISTHVITGCLHVWRYIFEVTIWIWRKYQYCCPCLFTSSAQGWIQSYNWSFTT
jgi:hypothetical protein